MELTADQWRIVQATYDIFRETGQWPVVDAIDRHADEHWNIDAYDVLRSLPPSIALIDRIHLREDQEVKLRVRAIARCENSAKDLGLFVRSVRWLAEKERAFRPTSPHAAEQVRVTSEQFATDLTGEGIQLDAAALAKVHSLATIEELTWGGTYNIEGDPSRWELNLRRNIRPFRRVETLDDYMTIRDRLDKEAEEARGVTTQHLVPVAEIAVDNRPYVFIAMPFGSPWSADIHQCIERCCGRVQEGGLALRWERADQIDQPGRITEQIRDALTAADVVIADISGLNPNVIYELGYADAGQTPLIILSQEPDASPFDLKDIRQIRYSPEELDLAEDALVRHLQAALDGTSTHRVNGI